MPQTGGPEQVSNFQLKASYWYVSHKAQVRRAFTGGLIVVCLALYSYSFYQLGLFLIVQGPEELKQLDQLTASSLNYRAINTRQQPRPLQIVSFDATGSSDGVTDFVVRLRNPNDQFAARPVTIQLLSGGATVATKQTFILPTEEKLVTFFGQSVSSSATASIVATDWTRVRDFTEFAQARLQFQISNIDFKTSQQSGIRGELPISVLSFDITNDSAYSYWHVGTYASLKTQGRVGAINFTTVDQLRSGETQTVEMRWFEPVPPTSQVEILTEVDILDPTVYMPVE